MPGNLKPNYCYNTNCKDYAKTGYCNKDWSDKDMVQCFISKSVAGLVKDDCKQSCNNCGGTNFINNKINHSIFEMRNPLYMYMFNF